VSRAPWWTRRAVLRGAGVALALPTLESLSRRRARAADAAGRRVRLVYWAIPNGVMSELWRPTEAHKAALDPQKAPRSFAPLVAAGVYGDVTVIDGLDNLPGTPTGAGDHASGMCAILTCAQALKSTSAVQLGVSADQIAAQAIGRQTPRPSLELGMGRGGTRGDCDSGYSCAYATSISWSDAVTPRPKRTDPHDAWDYLVGGAGGTAPDRERRRRGDVSVLDYVRDQAAALQPKLARLDRDKLDQYLTAVRAMEKQLATLPPPPADCHTPADPGRVTAFESRCAAFIELTVFALQCDLTRVVSFMMGNAFGPGAMTWAGVPEDYHNLTHHEGEGNNRELIQVGVDWQMKQFAMLLRRFKETPSDGQTLLHDTAVFLSSDVGRGSSHNHDRMPALVAGQGGGALVSGVHLVFSPEDTRARSLANSRRTEDIAAGSKIPNVNKVANLHVALLEAAGVRGAVVGNSSGRLPGVLKGT
jgi:hypothetical protein